MKLSKETRLAEKEEFALKLTTFVKDLSDYVSDDDGQWTVKGFIDIFKNIYTISSDTKIVSKILEIHLFPRILQFAKEYGYSIVLAEHQNWYPDLSFVKKDNQAIKFAVDLKTTCRDLNFQGHVKDFQFFVCEKWRLASDRQGSGNTANIGSITWVEDILAGNGVFAKLGEGWFDEYWMNYGITTMMRAGKATPIRSLGNFLDFKGGDKSRIVPIRSKRKTPDEEECE
jgi:hypothetical protein